MMIESSAVQHAGLAARPLEARREPPDREPTRVNEVNLPGRVLRPALGTLLVLAPLLGCGPRVLVVDRSPQAYYQTAYPSQDASQAIERAFRSLRRIAYTADYETYVFTADQDITDQQLEDPGVLDRAGERYPETHTRAGTAVVIGTAGRLVLLVTNNHVVRFEPRRVRYFDEAPSGTTGAPRRVAGVSILTRERALLPEDVELGRLEVLARDPVNDIAALELRLPASVPGGRFPPLALALGHPGRLSWGSFVYVLGYPNGYAMITRAIVSDPNRDRWGGFLTDGLWNEGISGGAILAIRGEEGALEWIGMTRAGAGTREVRLRPAEWQPPDDDAALLYDGPIYAESALRIQYGITLSVPITAVRHFLRSHRDTLESRGFDLRGYWSADFSMDTDTNLKARRAYPIAQS